MGKKKDWALTQSAFRRLLDWLDEGTNSGGQKYEEMRRRLISYFDRRDCLSPDDLADETLNRVAQRLEEEGSITGLGPAQFCYIKAKEVLLEYWRKPERKQTGPDDLLRLQVARESKSNPLVIAGPEYGRPPGREMASVDRARLKQTGSSSARRRSVVTAKSFSDLVFETLYDAEEEANDLKKILPEATVLTKEQATKAALKQAAAPRILHVATHGFFLEGWSVRAEGAGSLEGEGDSGGLGANVKIENPLLRSGLAMAGANLRKSGDDDGILTALEVSGLNLWGTKLVALSACDTGVGVVKTGEGVYGLRRALVLAGSETQVMSLWPVSDYMTRKLMRAYYTKLKRGEGRGEALRQAKSEILRQPGAQHPFYWASFIQSGEWANLDGKR